MAESDGTEQKEAPTTFNKFVLTIEFNEQTEIDGQAMQLALDERDVQLSSADGKSLSVYAICLTAEDGGIVMIFPWPMVQRYSKDKLTITFTRGVQLTQIHDGQVAVSFDEYFCGLAPNRIKRIEAIFDTEDN